MKQTKQTNMCFMLRIITEKIPKNISAESDLSPRAKAIQDYVASDSDELSFQVQILIRGFQYCSLPSIEKTLL